MPIRFFRRNPLKENTKQIYYGIKLSKKGYRMFQKRNNYA